MVAAVLALVSAAAFAPAGLGLRAPISSPKVQMSAVDAPATRRAALAGFAAAFAGALPALAAPEDAVYKLKKDYPQDARAMLTNMVTATEMARGTPNMEQTVKATRAEMNDFVAFYRRQPKVAGMPSFSTMYTAINTLSGHYASYGNKYPVPEKRKVRLQQQYKEIERALARGK
eukprot:CAMPEP_0174714410 /NCGR_PEP_ID=MMETSP1094-20130205/17641_1 /TAXON_ID=156173 /ORGANISM="Chrysochromulina brevifilum, Strain UTEX LB 985" /LENGTH=173 /DNA_ID=CAMNT_0015913755 /DNA_START=23 /DNA_END=544 /DNA_ORIENTATION=+